jgi:hypothetical protein
MVQKPEWDMGSAQFFGQSELICKDIERALDWLKPETNESIYQKFYEARLRV